MDLIQQFPAVGFTTVMMFIYRYYQTTGSQYIYLFSNAWLYSLGYFSFLSFAFTFCVLSLNMKIIFAQEAKAAFREDPKIAQLIANETLVFSIKVSFSFKDFFVLKYAQKICESRIFYSIDFMQKRCLFDFLSTKTLFFDFLSAKMPFLRLSVYKNVVLRLSVC
jgi:hypothetical protein